MDLKEAYQMVLGDLKKCELFRGIYDAKNGSFDLMCGVGLVMESIAESAGDDDFFDTFQRSMFACDKE